MGQVIVIASGKGGTGKTTCAGAIASFLARGGHTVLCIDCDIALRNLDLVLGMTDTAVTDLSDVTSGRMTLEEAAAAHPDIENLFLLPAPSALGAEDISPDGMAELVSRARDDYDYCIIDAPAGIGPGFRLAASGADMGIIVATGDATSLRDGQRAVMELRRLGVGNVRLIINRLSPRKLKRLKATLDDAIDAVGARLIGVVMEDDSVQLAANLEKPLIDFGARYAWEEFKNIAGRISGEKVPLELK